MFIAKTPEDLYAHVVNCVSSMSLIRRGVMHVELPAGLRIPTDSPHMDDLSSPRESSEGPHSSDSEGTSHVKSSEGTSHVKSSEKIPDSWMSDEIRKEIDAFSNLISKTNTIREDLDSALDSLTDNSLICNPITDDNPNRTEDSDEIWLKLLPLPHGLAAARDPEHYPQLRINNTTIHLHMPNISVYSTHNLPMDICDRLVKLKELALKCGITVVRDVHQATIEKTSVEIELQSYWPIGNRYASLYNAIYDKFDVYAATGFIPHSQIMNPETQYKLTAKFMDIRATYCAVRGFGPTICKKYGVGAWQDRIYVCTKIREIRVLPGIVHDVNCASCNIMCYGRAYTPDNIVHYCRCCSASDIHISSNNLFVIKCSNKLKDCISARLGADASDADKQLAKHIRMLYKYEAKTKDIRSYFPANWVPGVDSTGAKIEISVIETVAPGTTYIGVTEPWMDFMLCTRGRGANLPGRVVYYSVRM